MKNTSLKLISRSWPLLLALWAGVCMAQPAHTFTQYTSEDGLNQRTVQYIIQDHKGLMWLATWDGLYRFDGYTFINYKAYPGDAVALHSNRVEQIAEDSYGYIYLRSYDGQFYRFDRYAEQFQPVPYEGEYDIEDIQIQDHGEVWAIDRKAGIVRVRTDSVSRAMQADELFAACGRKPLHVNALFTDSHRRRWLLTPDGVYRHEVDGADGERLVAYLQGERAGSEQPIYAACEAEGSVYFTSVKGRVYRFDGAEMTRINLPTPSSVKFAGTLTHGRLLLSTSSDGFFVLRTADGTSQHYTTANLPGLLDNCIREVHIDSRGEAWMRHVVAGATHFVPDTGRAKSFILQDKYGRDIVDSRMDMYIMEDSAGHLWLHPSGGGLGWYDRDADRLVSFYNSALQSGWSTDNKVTVLFIDRQDNLWLCSYGNGLEKVTLNDSPFHLHTARSDDPGFPGNNTRAIFQDRDGRIWAGGKDRIIRVYDADMRYLGSLTHSGRLVPGAKEEMGLAYCFTQDHRGIIWIGTKESCGLISATPVDGQSLNFRLERYCMELHDPYSISGNDVYSLHEDAQGRLWIATFDGGLNYTDLTDTASSPRLFYNANNRLRQYPLDQCRRTRYVTSDAQGRIWLGSAAGLLMCTGDFSQPEDAAFRLFTRIPSDSNSLGGNDVHGIHFTPEGTMYVITFGGGLSRLTGWADGEPRFSPLTRQEGLPSDILLSIAEDADGCLWMTTEEELCRYSPTTGHLETYTSKAFPRHVTFNEGAALRTLDGRLMFNAREGIVRFRPDSVEANAYVPSIIFTNFWQGDESITPSHGGILSTGIDDTHHLRLTHDQNSFSIGFSALDFRSSGHIAYAYRLEGFDEGWNYIGYSRIATYTNLPRGTYTLMVRSTNGDGIWTDNVRTMDITVLPSFWETPWAYLLYVLIIGAVIFTATYILFTIFRLKHKVAVEQQIADIKLRFFTNISHDLRTPLTLIAGPIEHILQSSDISHEVREQLRLVDNNTHRMLRLVNQILDFRKMQNHKTRLRVQQLDLVPFVRRVMDAFQTMADEHEMDYRLQTSLSSLPVWVDADKLERVLFNLLGNAFKYTPPGRAIEVSVAQADGAAVIVVADQGVGISESHQANLFVRFENIADRGLFGQQSTGIGLSLVKEMVEMHGGTISVQSRQGEGSRFTISLPLGRDHLPADVELILADQPQPVVAQADERLPEVDEVGDDDPTEKDRESLLIVEDNPELRFLLRTILSPHFHILEASDGQEGLAKARRHLPDLVISDVMMPQMSGPDLTRALREDLTTSHILIVWLTARTDLDSRVEGMELGADDYLTKPFSATYLKARIFNLLERKRRLQALYCANLLSPGAVPAPVASVGLAATTGPAGPTGTTGPANGMPSAAPVEQSALGPTGHGQTVNGSTSAGLPGSALPGLDQGTAALSMPAAAPLPSLSPQDQQVMDRVVAFIERNIDNSQLAVDSIAQELHMSRSAFFRKLKALVGLSPVEFLRSVRMKRAAELIGMGQYSMTQIAYMVGLSDSHYFSKCFKQHYGITPTEYKAGIQQDTKS